MYIRKDRRRTDEMREIKFEPNFHRPHATLAVFGETKVICFASIEDKVPSWLVGAEQGWLTAEYSMLPTSSLPRQPREKNQGGRTTEIQRLIGRALRAGINLRALPPVTIRIDCDVLVADGGTRTAAVSGSFISLASILHAERFKLGSVQLLRQVAAVSVGILNGEVLLDLNYEEDSTCDVDANIVKGSDGTLIEIGISAERNTFTQEEVDKILKVADKGIQEVLKEQRKYIPKSLLPEL